MGLSLLTESNPKTAKGRARGYRTWILHLAPSNLSGFNTCPASTEQCVTHCLYHQGRGRMRAVQDARVRKTRLYFQHRPVFLTKLVNDLQFVERRRLAGQGVAVRLNGTSDIRWERHRDILMDAFPKLQFYDYTKIDNRRGLPDNYHLTFSLGDTNELEARRQLAQGINVAMILHQPWPETLWRYPVVDGDLDDLRFLDTTPAVVALKPKGTAARDTRPLHVFQPEELGHAQA